MARARKQHPILLTKRLRLRPFRGGDLKVLHALYGDPDTLRYWGISPNRDLAATRRMLRWHLAFRPRHYVMWAVEETKSRKVIGMINYHRRELRERRGDVGGLLLPAFHRRGDMAEAGRAALGHVLSQRWGLT